MFVASEGEIRVGSVWVVGTAGVIEMYDLWGSTFLRRQYQSQTSHQRNRSPMVHSERIDQRLPSKAVTFAIMACPARVLALDYLGRRSLSPTPFGGFQSTKHSG